MGCKNEMIFISEPRTRTDEEGRGAERMKMKGEERKIKIKVEKKRIMTDIFNNSNMLGTKRFRSRYLHNFMTTIRNPEE